MTDMPTITDETDIFAMRNLDHHRAFCEFLARQEDEARGEIADVLKKLDEISLLELGGVTLSPEREKDRSSLLSVLTNLNAQVRRISQSRALANDFMNA